MSNTISVINQKGGVGKTTSTLNLAACLAIEGRRVLIIDFDPQGNVTHTLLNGKNIDDELSTYEFLLSGSTHPIAHQNSDVSFDSYVKKAILNTPENVSIDVIPTDSRLAEVEMDLFKMENREHVLRHSFGKHQSRLESYDYIFLDCPPSLGMLTINAFVGCRYLLVPVDAAEYSKQGLYKLIFTLARCNQLFESGTEIIGLYCTKFQKRERVYREMYDFLKEEANDRLFDTVIRKSTHVEQAPSHHKTIFEHAPHCGAADDYRELANEIELKLNRIKQEELAHV